MLISKVSALVPIRVALDWFLNPHHAPLIIGKEKGIFARYGIDLEWIPTGGTEEGARQLAVKRVHAALSSHPRHLFHVARGLPLIRIATLIDQPLQVCIQRGRSRWKGKRIGFSGSGSGFSFLVVKTALTQQGLTLSDVQAIPQRWGLSYSLLRGHVDIAVDLLKTYDVAYLTRHLSDIKIFTYEELGVPAFDELIVVIHRDDRHNPIWKGFIAALKESINFIRNSPESALHIIQTSYPELTLGQEKSVWTMLTQLFTLEPAYFEEKKYEKLASFVKDSGFLPGPLPPLQDYTCVVCESADMRQQ